MCVCFTGGPAGTSWEGRAINGIQGRVAEVQQAAERDSQPGFCPIFPTLLAVNKSGKQNRVCLKLHLKFVEQKAQRRGAAAREFSPFSLAPNARDVNAAEVKPAFPLPKRCSITVGQRRACDHTRVCRRTLPAGEAAGGAGPPPVRVCGR